MQLDHYCPGCGGGAGNQACAIARCSLQHEGVEYCYLCDEYPCEKYEGIDEFDSFITHRNQLKEFDKVKSMGLENYHAELAEKVEILKYLLANCNDGRRKSFFCIAVNLLELQDIKPIMEKIEEKIVQGELNLKEKAIFAANLFEALAAERGIVLKLNKKGAAK